jgi:ADP-ribose pyrophosphatase YjhB (NUDIX family)
VRGAVLRQDGRILLVREQSDGLWTLPGGWADPGDTPSATVAREVREESGYTVLTTRLVAVHDRDLRNGIPLAYAVYKLFFLCELLEDRPFSDSDHEIAELG